MKENKQEILNALAEVLKLTRAHSNLDHFDYYKADFGDELVYVWMQDDVFPTYTVNVACDSGRAMINDVLKAMRY